ncbi:beta-ketoacyl-ACP synthase [Chelatococcus asaccharovorans]|uniref:beta-ketoacyl-ACP synthase n=1 Tax=Chelatococcus asaccharovorans TaxID=28210 RepID=UPI00224C76AA|nr:beta-ketoacyl-ACP synthase [Chelatococcus asaccharovorans]CAH1657568.1 3-oxoacyl-(acyl-carrier-protein) synthase II [Chelatococcus asaccharovorans]CAH1684755.1 3-oxoacyl-(acyl-carrier-protein) synthase II [Chelatococcus asaccharovorans]
MTREVWITGLGLLSSLGEGAKAHLGVFDGDIDPVIDSERFAPFSVHPSAPLEWDRQIPKKADQRQMEPWQRLGVYAAGLALEDAGLKGDAERLAAMQLIVAAGGGERDYAVDGQILTGLRTAEKPGVFLNERLMSDIRPTLFLAQLSNLLAGNISIVHGVTGATRTFMGEEQAGVDALRIAHARIAAGQGDTFLVGGAYNAERPDVLLIYEMGQLLWKKPYASVWDRPGEGGGFIPGSAAGFLVLEARETAEARGATPVASLQAVASDQVTRGIGAVGASVEALWQQAASEFRPTGGAILSGATGITGITEEERGALAKLMPGTTVHAMGDVIGHTIEAQFPLSVAIAAAAIRDSYLRQAVVTSVGHMRGEGLAFLTSV